MEVIELLKTSDFSNDDWQYVTDYAAYEEGLKNYNDRIKKRVIEEMTKEMDVKMKGKDDEIFKTRLHQIEKLLKKGSSLTEIADFFEIDMVTLQEHIKLLPKQ